MFERALAASRGGAVAGLVAAARRARRLGRASGLLAALERRRHQPLPLFLRSLLAVHDIEDLAGLDLPWWVFGAIERTDAFLRGRGAASAFEYGSGASTLWLARRCRRVVTVEHDRAWWPTLAPQLAQAPNVEARHVPPVPAHRPRTASRRAGWRRHDFTDYVRAIRSAGGPFDLIVIDGRARAACLDEATRHLAPGGLVVFDNSNRRRYAEAIRRSGLAIARMRGLAAATPWPCETGLLAREPATLGAF